MQLSDFKLAVDQILDQDWWVKIETGEPACTYYFGPFYQKEEAKLSQAGYVDDLIEEGAKEIIVRVERAYPSQFTVYEQE
ncbi:MAG: DUF1816 domain-containing protein [Nodosilinea sp.]